jgi:protein TonB
MASPAELEPNLPDTLPADFGEWDSSVSPEESPSKKPPEKTPKETAQRESARREAEAIDFAKKPFAEREVSREFEPTRNVTPFPEADEVAAVPPRGIPAPVIRPPRTSPTASPVSTPSVQDDSALKRRLKAIETVADKPPAVETPKKELSAATVTLIERKPDKPLFSSEDEYRSTLLNDQVDAEEERKTRRKWITTGCIFGGALLLVAFQLIHYSMAGKIKHVGNAPQVTATSPEPQAVPDAIVDVKPSAAKPSPAPLPSNQPVSLPAANTSVQAPENVPAAAQTHMMQTQLMAPTKLPQNAKAVETGEAPPSSMGGASMAALNGNNSMSNVFAGGAKVSGPKAITLSAGVAAGMLIRQTQPVYPNIAKSARVQGTVVMNAVISRTGKVTNVQVVSGPLMLRQAAVDAVKTWQYKPYMLNNEPTDINTSVNVVFTLSR